MLAVCQVSCYESDDHRISAVHRVFSVFFFGSIPSGKGVAPAKLSLLGGVESREGAGDGKSAYLFACDRESRKNVYQARMSV